MWARVPCGCCGQLVDEVVYTMPNRHGGRIVVRCRFCPGCDHLVALPAPR